ncbi:MAG TPA: class I SAM-dependent methyltransferase [Solirubrobacteraceae bacterium]|jgi:SAM-dependent methyltransferase|nr:class I SAM-dependent methyltransferase [Solirubrobacteraceae bacterium]
MIGVQRPRRLSQLAMRARNAPAVLRWRARRRRLAGRYLRGKGVEIGALHAPLPTPARAEVSYVDRMTVADLRRHYPELADERLVEVDIVDDGERLLTQDDASADFVIANHFIEHTEDPIGTLANHLRVLRPGGVLFMGVPDRRFTFDCNRPATGLAHLVADHERGPAASRRMHFEEWAKLVEGVPAEQVQPRARELEAENYSIHFHVWTAPEFAELLEYGREQARLPFSVETVQPNEHEFIVILRRD